MSLPVVLVVQESDFEQGVLGQLLARFDFSTQVVGTVDEAESAVRARKYAIILIDSALPGLDSKTCLRRIKQAEMEASSQTPVVSFGPVAKSSGEQEALAAGMDGYISQPFNPEDLRRLLLRFAYEPRRPNLKTLRPLPPEDLELGTV